MRCPYCKQDDDRVIDSRSSADGFSIRRRRECVECSRRFTTYERMEETPLRVVKKEGSRVPFDRNKIFQG
ncbi:MAG: transcriptional regulator NrdR, partial [Planctomycetota bacterium]|nr:transcriptional regulator NrdR [Planctomycetota bacterium]